MSVSLDIKAAMKTALEGLPAMSDGTEVLQVVTSGDDQFDKYPTIRIVPQDVQRSIDSENRKYSYKVTHTISIYLELANEQSTPDAQVIDTMQELVDAVFETLDTGDWLDGVGDDMGMSVAENDSPVVIDITASKTGVALYADIAYSVEYAKAF